MKSEMSMQPITKGARSRITKVSGPLPGPRGKALLEQWHRFEADVTGFQAPIVWDSAQGCAVRDVDGNLFIDWTSGVLVTNVGHCHPDLVNAVQTATSKLINCYENATAVRVEAAERLVQLLPPHLDRCFFLSTGSEATEAVARLMKRYSGKFEIITFGGAFHGRTQMAAAMGGMPMPKRGYGPTVPGVIRFPFPNPYRDPYGWCNDGPEYARYFDMVEEMLLANSAGSLAGVMVEPYQGTSGFIFPPNGWLKRLEQWTRARGLLFAVDEVQSSFGRTGRMWGFDHEGLTPDLIAIGKGIGGGIPLSAVGAREDIFSCLNKGEMSSTMGGNPISCAAMLAVVEIMKREQLCKRAAEMGDSIFPRLREIARGCRYVGDIRGRGLVGGLEFVKDPSTKEPAPELVRSFILEAANQGLIFGGVGLYGNVVRLAPPLVISHEEVDESIEIMERVLTKLDAQRI